VCETALPTRCGILRELAELGVEVSALGANIVEIAEVSEESEPLNGRVRIIVRRVRVVVERRCSRPASVPAQWVVSIDLSHALSKTVYCILSMVPSKAMP
jgi:hypothetical protein